MSAGALKLEGALDHFRIDVHGKVAWISARPRAVLPIACYSAARQRFTLSTLAMANWIGDSGTIRVNGPRKIQCARSLARAIPKLVDICVIDVSFISLTLILPNAFDLITPSGVILALIKSQFELQRADVGRGGVIRDPELQQKAQDKIVHLWPVSVMSSPGSFRLASKARTETRNSSHASKNDWVNRPHR